MKNDLSWVKRTILFSILFLINGYLADMRTDTIKETLSRDEYIFAM
jgi:hypothetical protein